jgi:electron transport complex protein RnfE
MLFGEAGRDLGYSFVTGGGFLLALLPPGAFLGLALLIALRNAIQQRYMARTTADTGAAAKVTGYT